MDIIKVACFALISVLSWELGINKFSNTSYFKEKEDYSTNITAFDESKVSITDKLGEFMMGEIVKGGDK